MDTSVDIDKVPAATSVVLPARESKTTKQVLWRSAIFVMVLFGFTYFTTFQLMGRGDMSQYTQEMDGTTLHESAGLLGVLGSMFNSRSKVQAVRAKREEDYEDYLDEFFKDILEEADPGENSSTNSFDYQWSPTSWSSEYPERFPTSVPTTTSASKESSSSEQSQDLSNSTGSYPQSTSQNGSPFISDGASQNGYTSEGTSQNGSPYNSEGTSQNGYPYTSEDTSIAGYPDTSEETSQNSLSTADSSSAGAPPALKEYLDGGSTTQTSLRETSTVDMFDLPAEFSYTDRTTPSTSTWAGTWGIDGYTTTPGTTTYSFLVNQEGPCSSSPYKLNQVCVLSDQIIDSFGADLSLEDVSIYLYDADILGLLNEECDNGTWCLGRDYDKAMFEDINDSFLKLCPLTACILDIPDECMDKERRLIISSLILLCQLSAKNINSSSLSVSCVRSVVKMTHVTMSQVQRQLVGSAKGICMYEDDQENCEGSCQTLGQQFHCMCAECDHRHELFEQFGSWNWYFKRNMESYENYGICQLNKSDCSMFQELSTHFYQDWYHSLQSIDRRLFAGVVSVTVFILLALTTIITITCLRKHKIMYSRNVIEYKEVKNMYDDEDEIDEYTPAMRYRD